MKPKAQVEYRAIKDLKELPGNPRIIKKDQFEKLKQSIKDNADYFEARPIILSDRTGELVILAGNQRYKAAKAIGMTEVPTILLPDLTEEREKEIIIRDNVENGDWDWDALANEWDAMKLADWGVPMPQWLESSEEDVIEDEVPEPPQEPKSKLGEIYQLGSHRLMVGDSTDEKEVAKLLNGNNVDLVFTDPPYELQTQGGGVLKSARSMSQIKTNGVDKFDPERLSLYAATNIFFHNKPLIKKYIELAERNKANYDLAIYKKQGLPNYKGHLMTDIEYIAIIGEQNPNQGLDFQDYSKVYEGKKDSDNELSYSKPVGICVKFIKLYSKTTVLDLFGGSGSTLIACEQLDRSCYMMELDPHYADVIIERWEKFTGQKAVRIKEAA